MMRKSIPSTFLLLASLTSVYAQDSTCYKRTNNQVKPQTSGWVACNNTATHSGGAELCCLNGSECGEDSICRSDSTKTGQSRWYVGACTDPNYNDPICRQDCTQYKQTFITYDSDKWQCCGNSGCDESPNGDETFSAVSPSDWKSIGGSDGGGGGLDLGEKIGIAVLGAVVVIFLLAVAIFCFCSKRTKRSRQNHQGVRGRYEEIGRQLGQTAPTVPYGARDTSPQPYGRSVSPIPPVRRMDGQRDRSRSIALEDRIPVPEDMRSSSRSGEDRVAMLHNEDLS